MAKTINFKNVEKLVFSDSELKKKLLDFRDSFQNWALAQQTAVRSIAQKITLDVLNNLTEKHIKVLSDHFNEEVQVEKLNPNVCEHVETTTQKAEQLLNAQTILKDMMFAYREDDQIYISFWR